MDRLSPSGSLNSLATNVTRRLIPTRFRQAKKMHFVGGPLRIAGRNDKISGERLVTSLSNGEPMVIHALSGYLSCLYLCEYPERSGAGRFGGMQPDTANAANNSATSSITGNRRENTDDNNYNFSGTVAPSSADENANGSTTTTTTASGEEQNAAPRKLEKSFLLLDSGSPGDYRRINHYLTHVLKYDGSITDHLRLCSVSHAHPDHRGSSAGLFARGVDVAGPDGLETYYSGFRGKCQLTLEVVAGHWMGSRLGRTRLEPFYTPGRIDSALPRLKCGMTLPFFNDWSVIGIPGHTLHHLGFYHAASGCFYVGDLMIHYKREFRSPIPVDVPEAFNHTLRRLRKLSVRFVLFAHGGIVDVDDVAGGWEYMLEEVAKHAVAMAEMKTPLAIVTKKMTTMTREDLRFDRTVHLPKGPLPQEVVEPQPVYWLRK